MIVVVTGARDYTDYQRIEDTLDEIHAETPITELRHGAAPGADALASHWAYKRKINVRAFGAKWGDFGSRAGPIRNQAMLNSAPTPDLVIGFPLAVSRGTYGCMMEARKRGIRVLHVSTP